MVTLAAIRNGVPIRYNVGVTGSEEGESRLWLSVLLVVGLYACLLLGSPRWAGELFWPAAIAFGVLIGDYGDRLRPWELALVIISQCSFWGFVLVGLIVEGLWGWALASTGLTVLGVILYRSIAHPDPRPFGLRRHPAK